VRERSDVSGVVRQRRDDIVRVRVFVLCFGCVCRKAVVVVVVVDVG
jgi:hypothetical protein